MKQRWRCRSLRSFFGLSPEYSKEIYEQFFFLKYYGGWSFTEAYNLPIGLRNWFIERLSKQLQKEAEATKKASSRAGRK